MRENDSYVEEVAVREPPPPLRRGPRLWPWLLALLVLVLAGLGALVYLSRDDDDDEAGRRGGRPATTTSETRTVAADIRVPDLVGLPLAGAQQRLADSDLRAKVRNRQSTKPRGRVLAQTPAPGTEVERAAVVTLFVSSRPPTVAVPDLVGLRASEALARLRRVGLVGRTRGVFSDEPPGVVVAHAPPAGERVKRSSFVRVNLSKGAKRVAVPAVVGDTASAATARLRQLGLEARPFDVPAADPKGTVIAQSPQPGAQLAEGEAVRINVSTGQTAGTGGGTGGGTTGGTTGGAPAQPAKVTLPDVVGRRVTDAQNRLQALGVIVRIAYVPSPEPAGSVVAQSPAAGASVSRGTSVRLNVAEGGGTQPRKAVPDVVGLTEAEAVAELEAAGFTARVFTESTPDEAEDGVVTRQEPSAGARLRAGARITLYVGEYSG